MRAGELRHLVTIDEPVESQNATGEEIVTWAPFGEVYAAIEPLQGRELAAFTGIDASTDTKIRLRWSPALEQIDPKWRIRHAVMGVERIYNVESIIDIDMRHREVHILATSGRNNG